MTMSRKNLPLLENILIESVAAEGKAVAARRDGKISIAEYLRRTDALTKTEKFSEA